MFGERESDQNNRITRNYREMKDHSQTEDTLSNKKVKGSAAEN